MKRLIVAALAVLLAAPAVALEKPKNWRPPVPEQVPNHREEWRSVVMELAAYAKKRKSDFIVMTRGGVDLVVKGDREVRFDEVQDPKGRFFEKRLPMNWQFRQYVKMLDGVVLNNFYCGPDALNKPMIPAAKDRKEQDRIIAEERSRGVFHTTDAATMGPFSIDPQEEARRAREVRAQAERKERQSRTLYAIDALRAQDRRIFSIDDCKDQNAADAAYRDAERDGVTTFAALGNSRLNVLPKSHPNHENAKPVGAISAARNWLPLVRGDRYGNRAEWIMAMEKTNYDMLLVDVIHHGTDALVKEDVKRLKYKALGAPRLVLAVLPVGKAYDWRWYWNKDWVVGEPPFIFAPDGDDPGSFITMLSDDKWKEVLGKYLVGIMDLGFDGVVLDDLDTYLWFEDLMPLDG